MADRRLSRTAAVTTGIFGDTGGCPGLAGYPAFTTRCYPDLMKHRLTALRPHSSLTLSVLGLCLVALLVLSSGCSRLFDGSSEPPTSEGPSLATSTTAAESADQTATTAGPLPASTEQPAVTTTPDTTAPPQTTAAPTTIRSRGLVAGGPREYVTVPGGESVVALTFDAAYDPAPLGPILAALEAADVPGTFFLTGEFVEDFPEATRSIIGAGHPIGNHSYSHPDFTDLDSAAIRDQLERTERELAALGAPDPRPLFRPPFGARNARVLQELANQGYVSVYWTVDTLDWKPDRTPAEIRQAVMDKLQPGAIVLMHVGSRQTAEILPQLIMDLKARGYGFVALSELPR